MARPLKPDDAPIELARNPTWRKRLADVRRAKAIVTALERERRRGWREALAFVLGVAASCAAALSLTQC